MISGFCFSQTEFEVINKHIENSEFETASFKIKALIKKSKLRELKKDPRIYFTYSRILKGLGKADSSYYYINKVEPLILSKKNKDSILMMYTLKAEISRFNLKKHLTDKNIGDADKFYNKNKDYNFKSNVLANFFNRKAATFNQFHFGNIDTLKLVIELSEKVITLENKVSDKSIIAYSMNEKAQVFDYYFDKPRASKLYMDAYRYSKRFNLGIPMVDITINMARNYDFNNELDEAIILLEEACKVADKNNQLAQARDVAGLLSFFYSKKGLYKLALEFKDIERQRDRLILINQKSRLIDEAEFNQRLVNQSQKIEKSNKEMSTTKRYLLMLVIVVVLLFIGAILLHVFNRKIKKKNKELKKLSSENEFLLSEANHRINNNLQIIIVLISEQLKNLKNEQQFELNNILTKIEAIATLHRHLYKNENKNTIAIQEYLNEILINFDSLFKSNSIRVNQVINPVLISTDTAMYLGLLLTELCINSIKHAFKNKEEKNIYFSFTTTLNKITFNYRDNGSGLTDINIKPKLIYKICRQLEVDCKLESNNGFFFSFTKTI